MSASPGRAREGRGEDTVRVDMLDAVRLLAAFQMIQGHTIDALLADAQRTGAFFQAWTWIRGLTAPIFLLSAGLSFALAASLLDEAKFVPRRASRARKRRVLRSLALILVGTLMHLGDDPLRIDVLQCVGVSLLVLDGLVWRAPTGRAVLAWSGVLAALLVAMTSSMDMLRGEGWPRMVLAWLGHQTGSLFPLFPWAAYVFGGVALAPFLMPRGVRTAPSSLAGRALLSACVLVVFSRFASATLVEESVAYSARVEVIALRAGCVLALMAACAWFFAWRAFPSTLRWLAGETLALYVFHLLFLFAAVVGPANLIGRSLGWGASGVAALVMLVLSALVARAWMWLWPRIEARLLPPEASSLVR